jgi:hypothetical protein
MLISVRDPQCGGVGDMMVMGWIALGEGVRPLNLSGPLTRT